MAEKDESGDEPPPLPEGLPPLGVGVPSSSGLPAQGGHGHTAESIARLPPKLRQRLLQRGILKETDIQKALQAKLADLRPTPFAKTPASDLPPMPAFTPVSDLPPMPAFTPVSDLPPMPAFTPVSDLPPMPAFTPVSDLPPMPAFTPVSDLPPMPAFTPVAIKLPLNVVPANVGVSAKATVPSAQQVYSSAPVLRSGEQDSEHQAAKRAKTEAPGAPGTPSTPGVPAAAAPVPPPEPEPPAAVLPPGWVRVPHEGEFYYWNTDTNEVSWENPAATEKKATAPKKQPKFTEEHRVLWTDIGKIIGRQGMNLKIIKASIGCEVHVPRDSKDGKGKDAKDAKGKSKGKKGKTHDADGNKIGRGIGDGSTRLKDDQFCTISVTADTAMKANGGKRCIEIMLGYGRNVERALADLGVEAKLPSLEEMTGGKAKKKEEIDPMDPASYSDAPVGAWSAGLKKPGQKPGGGPAPRDSKTANAERF